jgi:hypothetical protein
VLKLPDNIWEGIDSFSDNIWEGIDSFSWDHSHCNKFENEVSEFQNIMASIIHLCGIGPASYVVTALDFHPVTIGNSIDKYADHVSNGSFSQCCLMCSRDCPH